MNLVYDLAKETFAGMSFITYLMPAGVIIVLGMIFWLAIRNIIGGKTARKAYVSLIAALALAPDFMSIHSQTVTIPAIAKVLLWGLGGVKLVGLIKAGASITAVWSVVFLLWSIVCTLTSKLTTHLSHRVDT